jgi:endoglucanase
MGNLIALKKGQSDKKRVMAAAHMDEIGFIVTHIDEKGFIRFHTIGGFDPKTLTAQRVIVHGKKNLIGVMGAKPIHVMTAEERAKVPQIKDYFIDLGLPKEEVVKLVGIGDPITRERSLIEMGNNVNVKSLDNRVSVFILIEVLKEMKKDKIPYDFYGVFTVQEEVGLRGALVAGHHINPDFSFGLDTTIANDTPGAAAHEMITELGKGTAIKVMDASVICDVRMVEYMKQIATKKKIRYQLEILTAGGTDTAGMQKMAKNGTIAGAVSIPTRNIHQVIEMCDKDDIRGSIDLLKESVKNLDTFKWDHK